MRISIFGAGFVGVTSAVVFSEWGHEVELVEVDAARREALERGNLPFYEPGLEEAWASTNIQAVTAPNDPELIFVCVGTPSADDGSADLSAIEAVASATARLRCPIIIKSTVPPGTTQAILGTRPSGMNPEFLREGAALQDARKPDRVVIGATNGEAREALHQLYSHLDCPIIDTDPTTAEMIKYASNTMLASRIAMVNELGNVCQSVGVNVDAVMQGVGLDWRIGPHFLQAGLGFGGSCFPKDVHALRALARQHAQDTTMMDATLRQNDLQPATAVDALREVHGDLTGARVAIFGLAFKADTSDIRESRAIPLWQALQAEGAEVICYDPMANEEFSRATGAQVVDLETALAADAAIVQTAWPEFARIPAERWPATVIDGRRCLDAQTLRMAGKKVIRTGDGSPA